MPERRPIASRNTALAARIAAELARRGAAPNRISQASIAFSGVAGLAFWLSASTGGLIYALCLIMAALGCQLRLLCNLFDGMVAVEGDKGGPDGAFWNDAPDRLADTLVLVGMGLAVGAAWLGWAAAAAAIGTAYIRVMGGEQGLPSDFRGPMAKQHRMAVATVAALVALVFPNLLGRPVLEIALWIILAGSAMTVLRRSRGVIAGLKARGPKA